ncbi:hypothetical protein GCM10007416_12490 [Kroppenstedtia guangzhouensis]|uniref:Uncharacterized protein n=1 Tax=Kroppenstedtia guangzhouensis TaxID=1274356 RepID=A0ABQ1GCB2_9BACL|nr:hypothetical protein GCM10007416_12490 [Kroppenstedtia guangzhouensis]
MDLQVGALVFDLNIRIQIQIQQTPDPRLLGMQSDLFLNVKPELAVIALRQKNPPSVGRHSR